MAGVAQAKPGVAQALHGRVLELVIDNPAQRNALLPDVSRELTKVVRQASDDASIGAVVLRGEGAHFCAGGNLKTLAELRATQPRQALIERIAAINELARALRACPKVVIGAVEGHAAGAGFSIALGCDLLVAAEDAVFTLSYVRIGVNPDGGGSWLLARALPPQLASEMALTAAPVGAPRLAQFGVVNRLVAPGKTRETALAWAGEIAAGATGAIGRTKRLLEEAQQQTLSQHLEREREGFAEGFFGPEGGEGVAAFLEKRKAKFHG